MGLFEFTLKLACLASMISVCLHTPHTISQWPSLLYWLLINDIFCTTIFSIDLLLKINTKTILKDRWCQFDLTILFFHYASICIHSAEISDKLWPWLNIKYEGWWGAVRSPRPFIMLKFIRSIIRFKLPRNRIQMIIKRSSQQIQNVSIFFLFFITFYAIMGVQLFGRMEFHCVLPGTDPNNVTIADLAIPDTMCSPDGQGYECPPTMECMKLSLRANQIGFYGMFNDFASSLFTVYLAASQEGWVFVLYDTLDTFPYYFGLFYFITLIFFLAWLVKNVFIAVITETFAEIRVQFSEMWQSREVPPNNRNLDNINQNKLEKDEEGDWHIKEVDSKLLNFGVTERGTFRRLLLAFICSSTFQTFILFLSIFTLIFCIECLIKIFGLGWHVFWRRGQHKFELLLCCGSILNIIPKLYKTNYFTYFQVFRLLRLVKLSPMLEDFVYKIFGPGKKLGGLILFTLTLVMITSAISLQLFCYEGWTDVVVEILRSTNEYWVPFVAIYFVGYHLFVTLIVLSLFVAVILDNLEMDEELKKIKQLKAREETTTMRTQLPWRLRIFEKFPSRPQMIEFRKISREFPLPKMRDSFTRQFLVNLSTDFLINSSSKKENSRGYVNNKEFLNKITRNSKKEITKDNQKFFKFKKLFFKQTNQNMSKKAVGNLIDESNKQRSLLSDTSQHIGGVNAWIRGAIGGVTRRRREQENQQQKTFSFQNAENKKENGGDFSKLIDTAPKEGIKSGGLDIIDIKALQRKRDQAEFTRNRIEEEMRENHPFFDSPLFIVGRNSRLRRWCLFIVEAKYCIIDEQMNGSFRGINNFKNISTTRKPLVSLNKYKQIKQLIGLLTYLDWTMVLITLFSCFAMLFESPWPISGENMIFKNKYFEACDFIFVLAMSIELTLKIVAHGLFFTPNAVVRDVGGFATLFIFGSSLWYLIWMPKYVQENSLAQFLMICRAMRPLRIYTLVPHIRQVVVELCKGFREILLVTILLILFMFMFASFGLQFIGGKLAACNDPTITSKAIKIINLI
ncbi:unnamed protein product [Meloidogyne enterolobii]|uniref:Uncharacterized protein n=1 Tax=Meloidogyne enterolobii TaxID=390850 RepID=A0ACB0Y8S0_MELEN